MQKDVFKKLLRRPKNSHKYDFGHVLVIGGSPGMVGAPFLSAMAALRVGAGLVTIASTAEVISKLEERVVELMTLALPKDKPGPDLEEYIRQRKVSVIVIGPGMKPEFAKKILKTLFKHDLTLIIDGGGLTALASSLTSLTTRNTANVILTPHQGEFNRFFSNPLENSKLKDEAKRFALQNKVILVLKGNPTFVFSDKRRAYKNSSGGPALATAGSGDVLSGIIAGITAQHIDPFAATKAAVFLHGKAGEIAAESNTVVGVIASDVLNKIPVALEKQHKIS